VSRDEHEPALFARAAVFAKCPTLAFLTAENLREIAAAEGVDFATALLFDRVKRSEHHAPFIERIDGFRIVNSANGANEAGRSITIAIVPAAFYKEKPHSGADGRVVREAAIRMSFRCELIPLRSTGTLAENSTILLDWLKQHTAAKIILVSLCKGGADVKFALGASGAETRFANVRAWVNICGTLSGSPVAQWLLATKLRSFATWLFLKSGGRDFEFLQEIVPSPSGPLSGPVRLLPMMQLINIVGFPLRRHLTNGFMRRCHQFISPQGPNDGGVLLSEACRLPGFIYPVWGADHYLRPDERVQQIIRAVLNYLTSEPAPRDAAHSPEEPCRAN